MRIKHFRKWLNANKIFFEIAASLSVIFIAVQANTISKAQVENSELINQPNFQIEKLESGNLFISSDTFRYTNLQLTTASTLNYTYTTKNLKTESFIFHLPENLIVFDNYRIIDDLNLSQEIELNLIEENDSLFVASKNSLKSYLEKRLEKDVEVGTYFLQTFLELRYFDFKGNEQVLYYDITNHPRRASQYQAKPIIDEEYQSIYLELMGYEFLDELFYPKKYYDEDGNRILYTEGLEYYYDEKGRKIEVTESDH